MKFKVKNARLSYPSLFQTASFSGESTGKFECTFILDKEEHAELIEKLQAEVKRLQGELKKKLPADKICLKDGDDLDDEAYAGKITIKVSTKKRPIVLDRDKTPLIEEDGKPYAGCYVNGIFSLWGQDNSYGKRINGQLDGVQFYADGTPFGDGGASADDFDAFGDDDDDDF